MTTRATLLDSFVGALTPLGLLDRFQVAGAIASWWSDIQFDLRALAAGGFAAVIDGWVTTITTALDDKPVNGSPPDHRLVRVLLPEYLAEIEEAEAHRAELDAMIKGAISSKDDEAEEEVDEEDVLPPAELAALKKKLTTAKKSAKALEQDFVAKLAAARAELSRDRERELVLRIALSDLTEHLDAYLGKHRQLVILALASWWDMYAVPLRAIEVQRDVAATSLARFLEELGYG